MPILAADFMRKITENASLATASGQNLLRKPRFLLPICPSQFLSPLSV